MAERRGEMEESWVRDEESLISATINGEGMVVCSLWVTEGGMGEFDFSVSSLYFSASSTISASHKEQNQFYSTNTHTQTPPQLTTPPPFQLSSDSAPPNQPVFRPLNVFRCSGCTHQFNLHCPVIVDEATEFFKTVGVSDFTLTVANCGDGGVAQS